MVKMSECMHCPPGPKNMAVLEVAVKFDCKMYPHKKVVWWCHCRDFFRACSLTIARLLEGVVYWGPLIRIRKHGTRWGALIGKEAIIGRRGVACENSRPSSLPARLRETPLGPGAKDGCFRWQRGGLRSEVKLFTIAKFGESVVMAGGLSTFGNKLTNTGVTLQYV